MLRDIKVHPASPACWLSTGLPVPPGPAVLPRSRRGRLFSGENKMYFSTFPLWWDSLRVSFVVEFHQGFLCTVVISQGFLYRSKNYCLRFTVKKEIKCCGDFEILHEIVLDTTRKSGKHERF